MCKVLIWGTGYQASQLMTNKINAELVGFVESHKRKESFCGYCVYDIEEIPDTYDYIIVATIYSNEIFDICNKKGIAMNRVIFLYHITVHKGINDISLIRDILGEKNFTNYSVQTQNMKETFFLDDMETYKKRNLRETFKLDEKYNWPILADKYSYAGTLNNYFWQDLWAARLISKSGVTKHFDIGSRIDGFIGHLLAMGIDTTLIDIREFPYAIHGLHTIIDDATSLQEVQNESISSMSALCSLEHFGLGRYGDEIDPEACFKCFSNIQMKLAPKGNLYIAVPIGRERVEFNAHRVFYAKTIIDSFSNLNLVEFSCATCDGIEYNTIINKYDCDEHNGEYRYGLFHFVK